MPPDPIDELAYAWLAKAEGDVAMAEAGLAAPGGPGWAIAFHCQQAVEKCIKAQLVLAGTQPPHSHDLVYLFELAGGAGTGLPLGLAELRALHPFAVLERYPILMQRSVGREEVRGLLGFAQAAVAWTGDFLARRSGP